MKTYTSIETLIQERENLDWDAWLYCNLIKWGENPSGTTIYHITEDEALEYDEDEDSGLPMIAVDLDVDTFLEMETFKSIVANQLLRKNDSETEDFIKAINYYREYDTFID